MGVNPPFIRFPASWGMPNYRRAYIPGGCFFFTVTLAARGSHLLTERIDDLRSAYASVLLEMPFHTDAIVVLPDHLHAIWTLPEGDADFSTRWKKIKTGFPSVCLRAVGWHPPYGCRDPFPIR